MSQTKLLKKICTKCRQSKSLGDFHKRVASKKDGLQPTCKACESERRRRYHKEKRERAAEYQRNYYAQNRERAVKYREENREMIAETALAYRAKNKERMTEYRRLYYAKNRDGICAKARAKAVANPEKGRARQHTRRGATPASTPEVEALMKAHKDMPCVYCSTLDPNPFNRTTDHIVPVSSGFPGTQDPENLVPCCRACNCSKKDKDLDVWLSQGGSSGRLTGHRPELSLANLRC